MHSREEGRSRPAIARRCCGDPREPELRCCGDPPRLRDPGDARKQRSHADERAHMAHSIIGRNT
eukprot:1717752-Alexandrium_andersonii.AAC.1